MTVPLGESCSLHQATVLANITVYGSLLMEGGSADHDLYVWSTSVGGAFVCRASASPDLQGNTVHGSTLNSCS